MITVLGSDLLWLQAVFNRFSVALPLPSCRKLPLCGRYGPILCASPAKEVKRKEPSPFGWVSMAGWPPRQLATRSFSMSFESKRLGDDHQPPH